MRLNEILRNNPDASANKDWSDHKPSSTTSKRESLLAIHLQPFDSVRPGYVVDVTQELRAEADTLRVCRDPYGDQNIRLNFDGILATYDKNFIQVYRSSATEEVDFDELSSEIDGNRFDVDCIGATELDRAMFKAVGRRLCLLARLGVNSPVLVSVSLLNVKGCKFLVRSHVYVGDQPSHIQYRLSPHAIDRQNLLLAGLIVENPQEFRLEDYREDQDGAEPLNWRAVQPLLHPYCDSIWNAVGFPRSQYFDPDGKWVGHVYRSPRG